MSATSSYFRIEAQAEKAVALRRDLLGRAARDPLGRMLFRALDRPTWWLRTPADEIERASFRATPKQRKDALFSVVLSEHPAEAFADHVATTLGS